MASLRPAGATSEQENRAADLDRSRTAVREKLLKDLLSSDEDKAGPSPAAAHKNAEASEQLDSRSAAGPHREHDCDPGNPCPPASSSACPSGKTPTSRLPNEGELSSSSRSEKSQPAGVPPPAAIADRLEAALFEQNPGSAYLPRAREVLAGLRQPHLQHVRKQLLSGAVDPAVVAGWDAKKFWNPQKRRAGAGKVNGSEATSGSESSPDLVREANRSREENRSGNPRVDSSAEDRSGGTSGRQQEDHANPKGSAVDGESDKKAQQKQESRAQKKRKHIQDSFPHFDPNLACEQCETIGVRYAILRDTWMWPRCGGRGGMMSADTGRTLMLYCEACQHEGVHHSFA
ncbi:unnamed protein product [Amoebophrya sp. A120]|nr:unnamed protein product [Amoebophrya sp. A120]|eukprot:GSA120T00023532001.1